MNQNRRVRDIGLGLQVIFHLLPGLLTAVVYGFLGRLFYTQGFPSILGLYAATLVVLIPLEIGLPVVYERKKKPGTRLNKIFLYREKQPGWQIALLSTASLIWAGLVFLVAGEYLVGPVRETLFQWVPEWFDIGFYLIYPHMYKAPVRIFTWGLGILFAALIGPVVEEFYFRSYLLPRMSYLKWGAPIVGVILMSLYHFWSPWLFFIRVIAMLPMVYAVWWKKNVYIGIYSHCLLNLIGDVLGSIPIIFG